MTTETFWTAFSAISTLLACVVALAIPFIERQLKRRKKLKIIAKPIVPIILGNNHSEPMLCVNITNIGDATIYIKAIKLRLDHKDIENIGVKEDPDMGNEYLYRKFFYTNNYPCELSVNDWTSFNMPIDKLSNIVINKNSKIKVIVVDSSGKYYSKTTKYSINKILKLTK